MLPHVSALAPHTLSYGLLFWGQCRHHHIPIALGLVPSALPLRRVLPKKPAGCSIPHLLPRLFRVRNSQPAPGYARLGAALPRAELSPPGSIPRWRHLELLAARPAIQAYPFLHSDLTA